MTNVPWWLTPIIRGGITGRFFLDLIEVKSPKLGCQTAAEEKILPMVVVFGTIAMDMKVIWEMPIKNCVKWGGKS